MFGILPLNNFYEVFIPQEPASIPKTTLDILDPIQSYTPYRKLNISKIGNVIYLQNGYKPDDE